MDYKQKYEKALEKAKELYNRKDATDGGKLILESMFPELQESDDGRMVKSLKRLVKAYYDVNFPTPEGFEREDMISWLEKQREQKNEIKYIYPKFRVGDVIERANPNGYSAPVRVKYICEGNYFCESDDRKSYLSFPICDENEFVLTGQKPAWSEEDEKMLQQITQYLISLSEECEVDLNDKLKWLKSLKERYTWKPSDEQIEMLENVRKILHANEDIYSKANNLMYSFEELIRTLKKLREE